jgi:esterase/lipase superfamily enzyme
MKRVVPLLLVVILIGCEGSERSWTLFPAPAVVKDPRLDFAALVSPEHRDTNVQVFYATTRAPAPEEYPERYTHRAGGAVRLGVADVRLGKPGWTFEDLVASDRNSGLDSLRPADVTSVHEFGVGGTDAERNFVENINRQVRRSRRGEVVIYIPGYRTTFDQTLVLTGGFVHYLGHVSSAVIFSWPTGTHFWDYLVDCPRARAFAPDIARLIELVASQTDARRINLMAFSCGSPLLAEALVELRKRYPEDDAAGLQRRFRIANVLFVAADLDLTTFTRSQLPILREIARRTEVYLSEDDLALQVAALLKRASRLGRPRFDELTREELETLASDERLVAVDVAGVPGPHELFGIRGHGYFVANPWISSDVLMSLVYPFDPAWRGLVHGDGYGLWTFPDDYPERIGAAVYEISPDLRRDRR